MTLFKSFVVLLFLSACSSNPQNTNSWRAPNSETKTTTLTISASDIQSMIVMEGETGCLKIEHAARGNIKYNTYNCAHAVPFSFVVNSPSLGINKPFNGIHERTYRSMLSKTDISQEPGSKVFHEEQQMETKQYLTDVVRGCYGSDVIVTINEGDGKSLVTLEHHSYFGKTRCTLAKANQTATRVVVESYLEIKDGSKKVAKATADHAKWLLESADSLQQSAREKTANGLKALGEAISPN